MESQRRCTITPRVTARWAPEASQTNGTRASRHPDTWKRAASRDRERRKRSRSKRKTRHEERGRKRDRSKKKAVDRDLRGVERKRRRTQRGEWLSSDDESEDGILVRPIRGIKKSKQPIKRVSARSSLTSLSGTSSSSSSVRQNAIALSSQRKPGAKLPSFALRPEELAVSCKFLPSGKALPASAYWPPELGESSSESELSLSDGPLPKVAKAARKSEASRNRRQRAPNGRSSVQVTSVASDVLADFIVSSPSAESLEGVATVTYVASPRAEPEDEIDHEVGDDDVLAPKSSDLIYHSSPSDVDLGEFCKSLGVCSADETEPPCSVATAPGSPAAETRNSPIAPGSPGAANPMDTPKIPAPSIEDAPGTAPTSPVTAPAEPAESPTAKPKSPVAAVIEPAASESPAAPRSPVAAGESAAPGSPAAPRSPADVSMNPLDAPEIESAVAPEAAESPTADLQLMSSPVVKEEDSCGEEGSPTARFRALAAQGLPPGLPLDIPLHVKHESSLPADFDTAHIPPGFPPGFLDHLPDGSRLSHLNLALLGGVKKETAEDARSTLSAANTLPAGGGSTTEEEMGDEAGGNIGPQSKAQSSKTAASLLDFTRAGPDGDLQKKSLEEKLAALMVRLETDKSADTKKLVSSFWGLLTEEETKKVRETLPEIAKFAPPPASIPVATAIPVIPPKPAAPQVACTLRIQNLSSNVKAQQLGAVFGQYCIITVSLLRSKKTNALVGIVKLACKSDQIIDGENVRNEMDGKEIMGRKMKVTLEKGKKVVPTLSSNSKATPVQVPPVLERPKQPQVAALESVRNVPAPVKVTTGQEVHKEWRDRITFHGCVLHIAMNKMGLNDDGVRLWCEWMPQVIGEMGNIGVLQNSVLDFSCNQITDTGAGAILWLLLRLNVHAGDLCFGSNLLTDECAMSFTTYIKHMKLPLRMLGLDNNRFGTDGVMRLCETLATHPGYPLYDPLKGCYYPLRLTLQHNNVDSRTLFAKLAQQDIRFCQKEEGMSKNRAAASHVFIPDLVEDLLRNALIRNEFPRRDPRPKALSKTAAPRPTMLS